MPSTQASARTVRMRVDGGGADGRPARRLSSRAADDDDLGLRVARPAPRRSAARWSATVPASSGGQPPGDLEVRSSSRRAAITRALVDERRRAASASAIFSSVPDLAPARERAVRGGGGERAAVDALNAGPGRPVRAGRAAPCPRRRRARHEPRRRRPCRRAPAVRGSPACVQPSASLRVIARNCVFLRVRIPPDQGGLAERSSDIRRLVVIALLVVVVAAPSAASTVGSRLVPVRFAPAPGWHIRHGTVHACPAFLPGAAPRSPARLHDALARLPRVPTASDARRDARRRHRDPGHGVDRAAIESASHLHLAATDRPSRGERRLRGPAGPDRRLVLH